MITEERPPWRGPLAWGLFLGCVVVAVYALAQTDPVAVLAGGMIFAGAAFFAGVLAGFVFGIPRSLQSADGGRSGGDGAARSSAASTYSANTNLEQISDWLTKILVGAGLVELTKLEDVLAGIGDVAKNAFGGGKSSSVVAQCVVLYFAICGFLLAYLWTRLYLTGEFSRVERAARDSPEFYEGLMNAWLYQAPPTGFHNALAAYQEYERRFGEPDNERVWLYLAAAHGQRVGWEKKALKPDETVIAESRNAALEAVKKALQVNPSSIKWLRSLWDPNKATPPDDDLVVFFDDPGFKTLLDETKTMEPLKEDPAAKSDS